VRRALLPQDSNADTNAVSDGKQTPLHVAAYNGATNVAKLLYKVLLATARVDPV